MYFALQSRASAGAGEARAAGGSDEAAPEPLDAAPVFAPVGALVPVALLAVARGGTVVCAGIHMSDIPASRWCAACRFGSRRARTGLSEANRALDDLRRPWGRGGRAAGRRGFLNRVPAASARDLSRVTSLRRQRDR